MKLENIIISGNVYNVIVEQIELLGNIIVQTECIGRWPMSSARIGDTWLENELQRKVDEILGE